MAQDDSLIYGISYEVDGDVATFFVDMTDAEGFDPAQHSVFITGSHLGWPEPGTDPDRQEMVLIEDESTEIPVATPDVTGDIEFKFFSDAVDEGWDGGEWDGGPNRSANLTAGAEVEAVWAQQVANLQIIHNSPDPAVSSVDIFVNQEEFLAAVDFRTATSFVEVPAETDLEIQIAPAGAGIENAVGPITVNLALGENFIAVASGVLDPAAFTDAAAFSLELFTGAQTEAAAAENVDVNIHHGSPDAPNVDIYLEQTGTDAPAVADLAYPAFTGYVPLSPDNEVVGVAGAGGEILLEFSAPFADLEAGGAAMTVLASGFFVGDNATEDNGFGLLAVLADGTTILLEEEESVVEVTSIAELREAPQDGTVLRLTTEALLHTQMGFRNKKYITDGTGAIHIDDDDGVITTEYNIGDGITGLTGTLSPFRNELQFVPNEDPGPPSSTDNKIFPIPLTLAEVDSARQSQLIYLENVEFVNTGTFENGTNYEITDPSLGDGQTGIFRTELFNTDYIGDELPTEPVNLVAWVQTRGSGDDAIAHVTARFASDITPADAFGTFSLTAPANDANLLVEGNDTELITISWEAPETELEDVTYDWIATNPLALFSVPSLNLPSASPELTLPQGTVDALLEQFGVPVGESVTLKWTVLASGDNAIKYANEVWTVTIERGVVTSNEDDPSVPQQFTLEQNFPNPFNPSTEINYTLPQAASVQITVYNAVGQQVATLINNEQKSAGTHNITFDASNLASGIYLYRIQAGDFVQTRKMTLIK